MPKIYCTKQQFDTAALATKAMKRMKRMKHTKKRKQNFPASAYKCDVCGQYHWGHHGTDTQMKRQTRRAKP